MFSKLGFPETAIGLASWIVRGYFRLRVDISPFRGPPSKVRSKGFAFLCPFHEG